MCHEVALIISSVCVCVCAEVRLDHGKVEYLKGLERSHGRSVWDNSFKPVPSNVSRVATSAGRSSPLPRVCFNISRTNGLAWFQLTLVN